MNILSLEQGILSLLFVLRLNVAAQFNISEAKFEN